jgi:peptidoglycan/xylan/chitin deacetylase (PgdA/CDA1 family)
VLKWSVLAVLFLGLAAAGLIVRPPDRLLRAVRAALPGVLFRVDTEERVLALTIDDGPHPAVTPGILEVLTRHDVRATFFVLGENAKAHPALLDSIAAAGHEVANHFFEDRKTLLLPRAEALGELRRTEELLPERARWCRPGSGWITRGFADLLRHEGYEPCLATAIPLDIYLPNALAERHFLANVRPGAILVLHDGGPGRAGTVDVLECLLPRLAAGGWSVVPLGELAGRATRAETR